MPDDGLKPISRPSRPTLGWFASLDRGAISEAALGDPDYSEDPSPYEEMSTDGIGNEDATIEELLDAGMSDENRLMMHGQLDQQMIDTRIALDPTSVAWGGSSSRILATAEPPRFLPVEIVDHAPDADKPSIIDAASAKGAIEIEIAGGHRLRISGKYDPQALARLIRGLSG